MSLIFTKAKDVIKASLRTVLKHSTSNFVIDDFLTAHFGGKLFMTVHTDEYAGNRLLVYLQKHHHRSFHNSIIHYDTHHKYVRPRRRTQRVLFKNDRRSTYVFWIRGLPVIVTRLRDSAYSDKSAGSFYGAWDSSTSPEAFCVKYFPGTLDIENILASVLENAADDIANFEQLCDGYSITQISSRASRGLAMITNSDEDHGRHPDPYADEKADDGINDPLLHGTPIGFSYEDFVKNVSTAGLGNLALSDRHDKLIDEINKWIAHRDWFYEHDVPWRRGYMLYGAPGTGKTSFVRGLAMTFKIPIFSFDLAGFTNDELKCSWSRVASSGNGPRIILIEDIDATFVGRQNITKSDLTFDALLNCIDGAQQTDGVLLFITTNHRDKIDAALAYDEDDEIGSRPGRIDRIIQFDTLDDIGKKRIAVRILQHDDDVAHVISQSGPNETGAQFQERCIRHAYINFWNDISEK